MIRRGEVRAIRELSSGVQAQVCLGSSVQHGSATITVTTSSPAVQEALRALKMAVRDEAVALTGQIIRDDSAWRAALPPA